MTPDRSAARPVGEASPAVRAVQSPMWARAAVESPWPDGGSVVAGNYERSSIGRAPVSKTGGWGFDSLRSCCLARGVRGGRTGPADRRAIDCAPISRSGRSTGIRPRSVSQQPGRGPSPARIDSRRPTELVLVPARERPVPWAKSKTKCRRRNHRSPARQDRRPARGALRPVPGQPGPHRSLQADAGLVRPGLHRPGPGPDRRRRGLQDLRGVASSTRRSGGSACRPPSPSSWAG